MATYRPVRDAGSVRGCCEFCVFLFVCGCGCVEKDGSGINEISEHGLYLAICFVVEERLLVY